MNGHVGRCMIHLMKKLFLIASVTALVIGATGCGSLNGRFAGMMDFHKPMPWPYTGVKYDLKERPGGTAGMVLDLPLSFALDTALLPIEATIGAVHSASKSKKGKDAKPAKPEAPQPKPASQP